MKKDGIELTTDGDSNEYGLIIWLKTKSEKKAKALFNKYRASNQTEFTHQEYDDLISAVHFFISDYEKQSKQKAPHTLKDMERLKKKLWKKVRNFK